MNEISAPKIRKTISIVKWNEMTAKDVYNLQRALTGIFSLRTTFQGKPIKILGIKLSTLVPRDENNLKLNPGE